MSKRLRVDELARDWKVNPQTVRREIERGNLRAFKVGDTWRIPVEEIEKYEQQAKKKLAQVDSI